MIAAIRPRVVTVAAVVWLYVGPAWVLTGSSALVGIAAIASVPDVSLGMMDILPLFLSSMIACGGLGTYGAFKLLGMESRGRGLIELASWLALATILLLTLRWAYSVAMVPTYWGSGQQLGNWHHVSRALSGLLVGALVGAPFLILASKLRTPEVRHAIRDAEAALH
jgi:hypothetical protein